MKPSREALQKYPIELRALDKQDGGGWVAAIPGLGPLAFNGWGDTPQSALDSLKSVAEVLVDDYRKRGVELPDPPPDPLDYSGRLLLRLPRALHARLASEAGDEGVSLNTYLISVLSDPLQSPRNSRMLAAIHRHTESICRSHVVLIPENVWLVSKGLGMQHLLPSSKPTIVEWPLSQAWREPAKGVQ